MKLHFLGCGGFHPSERRHTACLMIPEAGIVFDAGTAAFRIPSRLQTDEQTVFLTHAHLDHILGLTYLLVPLLEGTLKQVRVFAVPAVIAAIREHLFSRPIFPVLPENLIFVDIEQFDSVVFDEGVTVTHFPLVSHPGGSRAYKIELNQGDETHLLAYVTDTTVDGTYDEFIRDVPFLIHECYFSDEEEEIAKGTGHSSTTMVAQLAARVNARKLMLVHVDPRRIDDDPIGIAAAHGIFPETTIADDLMCIDLTGPETLVKN